MYNAKKFFWALRALLLRPLFGALGTPSYLGPPIMLIRPKNMFIGRRVRIFPGLRAETHHGGRIHIGDNVSIGQNFHVTAMGDLRIGSGALILGSVMVTDIDHAYSDVTRPVHEQEFLHKQTVIGVNCFLGMGARIQAGTVLGDGCVVGANSVVRGIFPSHCVIVGAPARVVKLYDFESETWKRC